MTSGSLLRAFVNAAKTLVRQEYEGGYVHWYFWCPACYETHLFNNRMPDVRAGWDWNGDMDAPTFTPSLRYLRGNQCHLHLTSGVIHFCGDCLHDLKGQSVPMPQIPEADLGYLVPARLATPASTEPFASTDA